MGWPSRFGRVLKPVTSNRYLRRLLVGFPVYYTFTNSVADWYLVENGSMEPTLLSGQCVLVRPVGNQSLLEFYLGQLSIADSFVVPFNKLKRGDLIVAKHPCEPGNIIKRVTGLEGDRIPLEYRQQHRFVPAGQAWVEGDNAIRSKDSRNYGPVPLGLVQGKVVWRVWPFKEFGKLE